MSELGQGISLGLEQGTSPSFFIEITRFIPVILVLFFCIMSIFNRDLKAVPFLIGLYFVHVSLKYFTETMTLGFLLKDDSTREHCRYMYNTLEQPIGISHGIIGYIFTYVFLPMLYNENYNIFLLALLFILFLIDVANRMFRHKCYKNNSTGVSHVIICTLLGASIAASTFFILKYYDDPMIDNLLYYNVSQYNKVQCLRNSEVQYRCETTP